MFRIVAPALFCVLLGGPVLGQDLGSLLGKADKLLEESKGAYEDARVKNSVAAFVEAGFKLEEARIKYLVLQEIGSPDQQKLAADRLRSVNQLTKLIHDGKVAIHGALATEPATKAADAPTVPATTPAPAPATPVPDVTRRAAVPETAKLKEGEKLLRELFKEQYAKKGTADRRALSRLLLDQVSQVKDDPANLYVMYREALDAALQGGDQPSAFEAIDGMTQYFDIDPLAAKSAALATLTKALKTPEEAAALTGAHLRLADEYVEVDLFDLADKACVAAVQLSKKSGDAALATRAATRSKEVAEAKSRFQGLKRTLETLAKSPADPQANMEMGQYLCFVKGNWDLGLRFLANGADSVLKPLADKELAYPAALADRLALADAWWDLAQKETSPLRKGQLLAHACALYEGCLPETAALVKMRVQKRLEGRKPAGAPPGPAVDLLRLIDPAKDSITGDWKSEKNSLIAPAVLRAAWLQIPYSPPEEYDLRLSAARRSGRMDLFIGFVAGGRRGFIHLDGGDGVTGGIQQVDNTDWNRNETTYRNTRIFHDEKPKVIVVSVRKSGMTVTADGKQLIGWKGDYARLMTELITPNDQALFLGSWESSFDISQIQLTPVGGPGKSLPHVR